MLRFSISGIKECKNRVEKKTVVHNVAVYYNIYHLQLCRFHVGQTFAKGVRFSGVTLQSITTVMFKARKKFIKLSLKGSGLAELRYRALRR